MRGFHIALLGAIVAATLAGSPAHAAPPMNVARTSGTEAPSTVSLLHPPDPHKELRVLSKNLKLTRGQGNAVSDILQERAREIRLLLDVESLSQEYRYVLAEKVVEQSNSQIATLLKNKQKRKFDKVLARDHETL